MEFLTKQKISATSSFCTLLTRSSYENLHTLYKKNVEAFWDTRAIMKELNELVESSFGGMEAEKVKTFIEKTSYIEYEADKMKHQNDERVFREK